MTSRTRGTRTAAAALAGGLVLVAVPSAQAFNALQPLVVTANPINTTPDVQDGAVNAVAVVGNTVVIGGTFTRINDAGSGVSLTRPYIAAFDLSTGQVSSSFTPALNGLVENIEPAPDGASVFVAGRFTTVNGAAWRGLVKLRVSDGSRDTSFAGRLTNGYGIALKVSKGRLFLGGQFTGTNGGTRRALAAFDAATGAVDPSFNLPVTGPRRGTTPNVQVLDVTPDGKKMIIAGNFLDVAGQSRNQVAMIDADLNAVASWATDAFAPLCGASFFTYVRDIDFSPDGSYFVVVSTGGRFPATLCDAAARFETNRNGPGQVQTWRDRTGADTLSAVAVTGETVYIGGHQRWVNNSNGGDTPGPGAVAREGLAALDPMNGLPLTWNPGRARGVGVFDLLATSTGLWVASDTDRIGGEIHKKIAFFPLTGGKAVPDIAPASLPNSVYSVLTDGSLHVRSYNGTSFGADTVVVGAGAPTAPGTVRGAFMVAGRVVTARPDGHLYSAAFNGTTLGAGTDLGSWVDWSTAKALGFDKGRLYYTNGSGKLFYRYFSIESGVVGSELFTAAGSGYADAQTLFFADNALYFAKSDQRLYRVPMSGDRPSGTPVAISGPAIDGISWNVQDSFLSSPDIGG